MKKNNSLSLHWMPMIMVSILLCVSLAACKIYSFTGANLSPDVKSVTIDLLDNRAASAPASYAQIFTEKLKLKMVTEANLKQVNAGGDLHFSGYVTSYTVSALAPTAQVQTGVNRLNITVHIEFVNATDEKDKWGQDFTRYAEFPATELLSNRESQLIEEINKQLVDDIFNKALVKW
ncbi:MAG: LptE family protein [Chitinophagales bacterium]